jgi:hypothetical protein
MSRPYLRVHSDGRRYYIRWWCEETGDWRMILRDFKFAFEPHERRLDAVERSWSVPLYCRARVRQWADRWFDVDEREFSEDQGYGSRSYSDSQSSYGRYGGRQSATTAVERAYAELHLLPTAPPEVAQAAHRAMLRLTHPDAGGTHEQVVKVNLAWELVSSDLEKRSA